MRPTLTTSKVDKSVRGMTSRDESIRKQSVQRCTETPPVMAEERDCKCVKAFVHIPKGIKGSSGDVC